MKNNFAGYYRLSENEFIKLWKDCLFVLDANVLLNLYRYPKGATKDLIKVLKRISDRLWVPHQVALEYQENRLKVIAEQMKRFDDVRKILAESSNSLRNKFGELQLKKRHSSIDPEAFLMKIESEYSEFTANLTLLEKEQQDVSSEDTLRNELDELLNGKTGMPFPSTKLEELYKEGKIRYEQKCPPGYEDIGKGKPSDKEGLCYFYNGLSIKREYGDLILWYQIIDEAKLKKYQAHCFCYRR
ncbi:MAG: DUF4935 domain-containing protein [Synechococcaceae cyanobacterium SM1_2_3]|nr:DUF4935 domain-containing protein [Synechococcaceae cyanobacterium SM1_2_3]